MIELPSLRHASRDDLIDIGRLLGQCRLPFDGVEEHVHGFRVATLRDALVGVAGLEVHDDVGLLRSVAVASGFRRRGIAERLIKRIIDDASERKLFALYLLTEAAAGYFERHDFRRLDRDEAPGALLASAEFQGACPASAVLMGRRL